jgi:hypothetical protein
MTFDSIHAFFSDRAPALAFILGTNEIASAIAVALRRARYAVVLGHDPFPPVIRRGMAFHDALFGDPTIVDGITGEAAETVKAIARTVEKPDRVAVTPLLLTDLLAARRPDVLVDARMQKHRITPDYRNLVPFAIGIGPNVMVDANCDLAIETHPSRSGAILRAGETQRPDGKARVLGGMGRERFVYSARAGLWHTPLDIGARVFKGIWPRRSPRQACSP